MLEEIIGVELTLTTGDLNTEIMGTICQSSTTLRFVNLTHQREKLI